MKEWINTQIVTGVVFAFLLGSIETAICIFSYADSGAPFYGLVLAPLFLFMLFIPVCSVLGLLLAFVTGSFYPAGSREFAKKLIAEKLKIKNNTSNVASIFIFYFLLFMGITAAGTYFHIKFDEIFNNKALSGALLITVVILTSGFFAAFLKSGFLLVSFILKKCTRGRNYGFFSSCIFKLILGVTFAAAILFSIATSIKPTLVDINADMLIIVVTLPVLFIVSNITVLFFGQRFLDFKRIRIFLYALCPLSLIAAFALGSVDAVISTTMNGRTPSTYVASWYRTFSDFDADGAAGFFGGPDCAPFNPNIGPHAKEIPNNGIDDNCLAGDAVFNSKYPDHRLENPKAYARPPKDFPKNPNLVLIVADALRADHMSLYGYERKTTPGIDRHAKSAVVFNRAYSQGTGTISSMPSLFTGKFPYQLKYTDDKMPPAISPQETTLAEHLKKAGYATYGVTQIHYTIDGRWRLLQGFDNVDKSLAHKKPIADKRVTSEETFLIASEMIKKAEKHTSPYFLWVHFYDVHSKYKKHKHQKSFGNSRIDLYDGEILFTDKYISKLLSRLLAPGMPPTVVVLAADHGDGFRSDRGYNNHAYGLFNELIHVPLIIWAPGQKPGWVNSPVGNIDITPTMLNAAGLQRVFLRGHSLFPYIYDGYEDMKRLIFSAKTFGQGKKKRYRKSATGDRWKMIRWITEKREFLFDLKKDPHEKKNVLTRYPQKADMLRKHIGSFLERNAVNTLKLEQNSNN